MLIIQVPSCIIKNSFISKFEKILSVSWIHFGISHLSSSSSPTWEKDEKIKGVCGCNNTSLPMPLPFFLTEVCVKSQAIQGRSARMSSDCTSLALPLVTKTVEPAVYTTGTNSNFQLSTHLALSNKRLCHPLLISSPPPFSCVVHSAGNCSTIFAQIPWPESVIQHPWWCLSKSE